MRESLLGRTRLVNRVVITSDRRVAAWGALRANWIYLKVGARWVACGDAVVDQPLQEPERCGSPFLFDRVKKLLAGASWPTVSPKTRPIEAGGFSRTRWVKRGGRKVQKLAQPPPEAERPLRVEPCRSAPIRRTTTFGAKLPVTQAPRNGKCC